MQVGIYKKSSIVYNTQSYQKRKSVRKMEENRFCSNLAALRRDKGVSQRKAAADLHISQALLSHYENGARPSSAGSVITTG